MGGAQKARSIRTARAPTSPCIRRKNQNGIAELVRSKTAVAQRAIRAAERGLLGECTQQLVVARAGLMSAGQNRIDDAQTRIRADALVRNTVAGENNTKARRRMLECAHDGSTDR